MSWPHTAPPLQKFTYSCSQVTFFLGDNDLLQIYSTSILPTLFCLFNLFRVMVLNLLLFLELYNFLSSSCKWQLYTIHSMGLD